MAVDHVHHFFFRSNFVKNFPYFASLSCDYISLIREFNSAILVLSWPRGRTWMERNLQPNILIFFVVIWVHEEKLCEYQIQKLVFIAQLLLICDNENTECWKLCLTNIMRLMQIGIWYRHLTVNSMFQTENQHSVEEGD